MRRWAITEIVVTSALAANSSNILQPLSIPASSSWGGNDGNWSTFQLEIGTPPQTVHLLPGTSATAGDSIWVVIPQGCTLANPSVPLDNCSNDRGGVFASNASSTYSIDRLSNGGLFELDTMFVEEQLGLGLNGNALYGFDTISLGSNLPTLPNQLIAGIATDDFWLGSLGISPWPLNMTNFDEPVPSLLGGLKNVTAVSSLSWAYTAGASYKTPSRPGSLTLGGYDENMILPGSNPLEMPFYADLSRDLQVGLKSVTIDTLGASPLLSDGVWMLIDSIVTHLWLPVNVCEAFEQAFGLVWNETVQLYLLNETQHAALRAQNPTFSFTIGSSLSQGSGNTTTITLPYASLDLNVSGPFVDGSQPYFPLKRALNDSQYILGRVFLQEAYVIADYERKKFTVAQAASPSTQKLVTISTPGVEEEAQQTSGGGLSSGAIAGIVVGAVVGIALIVVMLVLLRMRSGRRRRTQVSKASETSANGKPHLGELMASTKTKHSELEDTQSPGELGGSAIWRELETRERHGELAAGGPGNVVELPSHVAAAELEAGQGRTDSQRPR